MTYTFATLQVSREAFDEIEAALRTAGYQHALVDGGIDMHGIGLVAEDAPPRPSLASCPGCDDTVNALHYPRPIRDELGSPWLIECNCGFRMERATAKACAYHWNRRAHPTIAPLQARPLSEWHEDDHGCVWFAWDAQRNEWMGEPAWIGTPLDEDWPGYHTHYLPHPPFPAAVTSGSGHSDD